MTFVRKATLVKNKEEGKKGKEEEGKKKRVDVKETRNLAKNKGREKKDGRKRPPHRHLDDREGVGMTITGTEVSVRTDSNNERVARRQQQPLSTISCICWIISSYRAQ